MPRKLVGHSHQLDGLMWLMHVQAPSYECRIEFLVDRMSDLGDNRIVEAESAIQLFVHDASLCQARVDLDVRAETVLLTQLLHHLECLRYPMGVPQHLHEDAERVVRRGDAHRLHLFEYSQGVVCPVLLRTPIQDGVVHNLIRWEIALALHVVQNLECPVDITFGTVTLHDRRVCDDVGRHGGCRHILKQPRHVSHAAGLRTSI
mmetsp:Transcript_45720/g.115260  ORF Transcript_45720/g.115260 Transcript_45720/m.115260 type:complete len:204 (+) Transcript_45720:241-852(+)